MAGLVRAAQSYWAGNSFVQEGTVLAEGDPRIVPDYVEDFQVPQPPVQPEVKRGPGRPRKNGE